MKLLTNVKSQTRCVINWMLNLPTEAERTMQKLSLAPGSKIRVIQNNSCGIIIGAGEHRLAIDHVTAERIWVRELFLDTTGIS